MKKIHLYAGLFPKLSREELRRLSKDIKLHGLRSKIVLDKKGRILDGQHRELACAMAGVAPEYVTFEGTEEEELAFVRSQNELRRHLTASQRASMAARLLPTYKKLAKARQKASGGAKKGSGKAVVARLPEAPQGSRKAVPASSPKAKNGNARDEAGKAMGVSGRYIDMADKVHAQAIPEIISAVDAGDLTLPSALLASEMPTEEQRRIFESGGAPAVCDAVATVRRSRGRIVAHDLTPPAQPVPEQSRPPAAQPHESMTSIINRLKALPVDSRNHVMEVLLKTLPDSDVLVWPSKCDSEMQRRRNQQQTAKHDNG